MATLRDVAKLANVDVSTVSRALNNTSYVHPETKKKIYDAVNKLSYHPNLLARGLRQGKRNTIGVIVPRMFMTIFAEITQGIEEEARRKGYCTLICHTEDDAKIEKECLNRLRNGFIDGLIIAGTGHNSRMIRDIHATGLACTQLIRQQDAMLNSVVVDYKTCGYEATNFIIKKGCKNIGLINGSMKISPYSERYAGYHKAMAEHELKETTAISSQPANLNSLDYGYNCALELLESNPHLDAVLAAVDAQGIGAIRALKERGLFPGQVKVLSLTGHAIGGMMETTMSSMEMPAHEIGVKAAAMTIEEIEAQHQQQQENFSAQHLVFRSVLVEREST